MKKTFIFAILTLFWIILLFPKDSLWSYCVQLAKEQNISVLSQKQEDKKYKYEVKQLDVYLQSVKVATLKTVEFKLWIFYNEIEMQDIELSPSLPIFGGLKIQKLIARYMLISTKKISLSGMSKFGNFKGEIDIFKHSGYVLFKKGTIQKSPLREYFKKTTEGMRYEFTY